MDVAVNRFFGRLLRNWADFWLTPPLTMTDSESASEIKANLRVDETIVWRSAAASPAAEAAEIPSAGRRDPE